MTAVCSSCQTGDHRRCVVARGRGACSCPCKAKKPGLDQVRDAIRATRGDDACPTEPITWA